MSSRLDPYFSQLFVQLNDQGLSYRTVASELLQSSGIAVSPQALRSWHLRRTAKLAKRAKGLMAVDAIKSSLAPVAGSVTPMPPSTTVPGENLKSVVQQIADSDQVMAQRLQLQAQIAEEERRLSVYQSGAHTRYPVRRRAALVPSTNQVFQTNATGKH